MTARAGAADWSRDERVWSATMPVLDLAVRALVDLEVDVRVPLPRQGPVLLVANHVGYLDGLTMMVLVHRLGRRAHFLITDEAWDQPVLGRLLRAGGHIPVRWGGSSVGALRAATRALRAGEAVFLYPEGTVPTDGPVRAKEGVGMLALTAGAPVVPLASRGLERDGGRRLRRRRARVVVGAPLELPPLDPARRRAQYAEVADQVLGAVRALGPFG